MKKIVFFITHKTLDEEKCRLTFQSLSNQSFEYKFDTLYIYNTHQDELTNDVVLSIAAEYNIKRLFNNIKIFNYDNNTHKSLGGDVYAISKYMVENYLPEDRVLFLKSDCLLSVNYFRVINSIPENEQVYFTAPFVCAKRRITNNDIIKYTLREVFTPSDEITFFVEGYTPTQQTDFTLSRVPTVTDKQIEFTACTVITDFSCHYINVSLLHKINITKQSWGGVNFGTLASYFIGSYHCFVVHKYHDIVSDNRATDREGPVVDWLNS